MKYVALVSGGKDSCMNLLYAQNEGHELVACANLRPKPSRPEEIDSFMFQTVGAKSLKNLTEALGVPLYTLDLNEENSNHEIDDIVTVLRQVLADFPDIKGVSVGAIGSVYQQVRVDLACQKLGLTALSYLWQRDQSELLQDIIDSGLEARMIKVAGYGLNETHLGKTLAELQPTLLDLHEKWGLYPCGEGGEYETMVFDGPNFKKRMVMVDPQIVQHSTGDVYYLTFDTKLEDKSESLESSLNVPKLWDEFWAEEEMLPSTNFVKSSEFRLDKRQTTCKTFSGSLKEVALQLSDFYSDIDITHTFHVVVIIDDMAKFAVLNETYNKLFGFSGPPSRKCIAANIPHEAQVTVFSGDKDWESKGIHVQGRSYWAPANIGPYSQARMWFGLTFLAGQIGLVPSTLELLPDPASQCKLALQNAIRICDTMHGKDNWTPCTAVVYITASETRKVVSELWPFHLPLVVAHVKTLPRGAVAEWDLTSIDLKYLSGHPPEDDDLEDAYNYTPRFVKTTKGYECFYGNHKMKLSASGEEREIEDSLYLELSTEGKGVPVSSLYYDGEAVDSVSIEWV